MPETKQTPHPSRYTLNPKTDQPAKSMSVYATLKRIIDLLGDERRNLLIAFSAILVNATINMVAPMMIGYNIDHYVQTKQYHGILVFSGILLGMYLTALVANYLQTKLMGGIGQRTLYNLRNRVFSKLQELPVEFFNQNQAGDLISRINNDTDKLNQFFSHSLMQFVGSIFMMLGAGIFLLSINFRLGAAALAPALLVYIFTQFVSPWVKRRNAVNMKSTGTMSAEIQESLNNFRVIIAFNRRDYFRRRFDEVNEINYRTAIKAGLANNIFMPVYGLASNIGQFVVLAFGIYLISTGHFSIGLLISFLAYINNFYNPMRQLAALWANFQVALAGWDRISQILDMHNDMTVIASSTVAPSAPLLSFRDISFRYPNGKEVLHHINFDLERGKTYAFVGPTGGGKTTTASLIARLYDPTEGTVLLNGKDLRSISIEERTQKIGFILQEPFLFSGTLKENILYGNSDYAGYNDEETEKLIRETGLERLLEPFENGLATPLSVNGDGISLGQKQLIAFMRAILRKPDLLILDEATANIDTVTEQLLDSILEKLPATTTRVIIAHRLNTITNADEIFFISEGEVQRAGSLDDAIRLLLHGSRKLTS
ncbi:ABC transporter ATP-binding protein [Parabacteroides sp. FAFU027]|uniref:ABC transporter ATP-binding protein n=1 Tax=Parabacteroides sp. FAFU027 TaxID=2922715 RepID=UPI001FAE9584|nr:ABC transporter ATP-binding protein [Parabacteroides sp. FAFU027]